MIELRVIVTHNPYSFYYTYIHTSLHRNHGSSTYNLTISINKGLYSIAILNPFKPIIKTLYLGNNIFGTCHWDYIQK